MTDDEINKRIAEIEGVKDPEHGPEYVEHWSWCGPLIEKYQIDLDHGDEVTAYIYEKHVSKSNFVEYKNPVEATDADVRRAICLAVIAKHET